jgi:hypothetical protein
MLDMIQSAQSLIVVQECAELVAVEMIGNSSEIIGVEFEAEGELLEDLPNRIEELEEDWTALLTVGSILHTMTATLVKLNKHTTNREKKQKTARTKR